MDPPKFFLAHAVAMIQIEGAMEEHICQINKKGYNHAQSTPMSPAGPQL